MKKVFLVLCCLALLIVFIACQKNSAPSFDSQTENETETQDFSALDEEIDFSSMLEFELSEDGGSYIVSNGEKCLEAHVVVPSEYKGLPVTEIGVGAFCFNTTMISIELPNTIRVIDEMAFDSCPLKSITIPDSVEKIGDCAFSCSALESVTFGSGLKKISSSAFDFTKLKRVVIPSTVETIGDVAFACCDLLEEVVIEDGVKRIEQSAFADCKKLKKVIFPNTLEYMEADVFEDSLAIEYNIYEGMKYLGTGTNPYFALVGSNGATQLITHTDTVFYMSEALLNCENIVSVEVGPNVKFIGKYALAGMDALEEITVHSDNAYYYVVNNILFDKSESKPIQACKTSVIPSDGSITELDLDIFSKIASIEILYIPKGIKTLCFSFDNMMGLEMVILESDIEHFIVNENHDGCNLTAEDCYAVYYCHTKEQWENVEVEYTFDRNMFIRPADCYGDYATHYFYSETEPTGEGNYWHYVDGVPTPWENSTSSETEE